MRFQLRRPAVALLFTPLLLLLAVACSGESKQPGSGLAGSPSATASTAFTVTPTPAPAATPSPVPTRPVSPDARPFSEAQRQTALQILDRVGQLRGSPSLKPVDTYVIGRTAAIEDYAASISEEDRRLLGIQSRMYGILGLIPDGTSYLEVFLGLLKSGVLGYYDPDIKAFFLLDDLGGLNSQTSLSTIVHEFAHALQDESYDINAMYKAREKDWDASTAMSHLIEGNAVATEGAYFGAAVRPRPACFQMPGFSRSNPPYTIVRELNSWYDDGLCFLQAVAPALVAQEGVFKNPPVSTEHVFHPEKYNAGERPLAVTLPSLLGPLGSGWSLTESSTIGEFTLQNLLIQGLPTDRTRVMNAAAGWGGDRWALYENGSSRVLHSVIAWDTAEDAQEFWAALLQSLAGRGGAATPATDRGAVLTVESKTWRLKLDGSNVTLVVADNVDDAQRVATAAGLP